MFLSLQYYLWISFGFRYLVSVKIKSTSPYWTSSNVNTDDAIHSGIFRCGSDVFIMIWCNFIWLVRYPSNTRIKTARMVQTLRQIVGLQTSSKIWPMIKRNKQWGFGGHGRLDGTISIDTLYWAMQRVDTGKFLVGRDVWEFFWVTIPAVYEQFMNSLWTLMVYKLLTYGQIYFYMYLVNLSISSSYWLSYFFIFSLSRDPFYMVKELTSGCA